MTWTPRSTWRVRTRRWTWSFVLVPDRTRIATIVSFERGMNTGIQVLGGGPGADPGTEIREGARLELARLAQDAKLKVFVSRTFPLAEVADAHRAIMEGHTQGKIALIPQALRGAGLQVASARGARLGDARARR